jgi:hypothetical protein
MIGKLLAKYQISIERGKFRTAEEIEAKILRAIETWEFTKHDQVIEQLTRIGIGG